MDCKLTEVVISSCQVGHCHVDIRWRWPCVKHSLNHINEKIWKADVSSVSPSSVSFALRKG